MFSRRNALDRRPHLVAQHRGKTQKIRAHNRHARALLLEHQRAHRQFALLPRGRMPGPTPPLTGSSGSGRDVADGDAGAESRGGIEHGDNEAEQKSEQFRFHDS